MICTSALHIAIHAHRDHISAGEALGDAAGSAVVFAVGAIVIWPVGGLLGYHVRVRLYNFHFQFPEESLTRCLSFRRLWGGK